MEALQAIITRRSTRRFEDRVPSRELLDKVIEAGRHAPSGHNNQTTHFIVITDRKVLDELANLVSEEFSAMDSKPGMYVSMSNSIQRAKKGGYVFHYNAPVLIVAANRIGYGNAMADSACALENMMIAANALDMGSCWINQLHWLADNDRVKAYLKTIGLEENETVTGALALGYSADGLPCRTPLERKGNPVTYICP